MFVCMCVHLCCASVCGIMCVYMCVFVCICVCVYVYLPSLILLKCLLIHGIFASPSGEFTLSGLSVLVFLHINCGSTKNKNCVVFFLIGATHPSTVLGTNITEYVNVSVKATTSFTPSIHLSTQSATTRLVSVFLNLLPLNTGTLRTKIISGGCPSLMSQAFSCSVSPFLLEHLLRLFRSPFFPP